MVIIGKGLEEAKEARLIQFLHNNQDVFAWSSSDLRGVSREVIEHELRVNPKAKARSKDNVRRKAESGSGRITKIAGRGVIREV